MAPRPDVSDKRKAEIVEAAARVFSKKGFGGARMDDIVQETGLSKGLLYWYFKSKDALIVALLERLMRPELNRVRTLADAGGPARERLVAFAESMVKDIALMERLMPITFEFYSVAFRNKVMKEGFPGVLQGSSLTVFKGSSSRGSPRESSARLIPAGSPSPSWRPWRATSSCGCSTAQLRTLPNCACPRT